MSAIHSQALLPSPQTAHAQPIHVKLLHTILLFTLAIWFIQLITGFRAPWSSIVVSDGDSGAAIRQLAFTAAGLSAFLWFFFSSPSAAIFTSRGPILTLLTIILASTLWSQQPSLTIKRSIILLFGVLTLAAATHASPNPKRLMLWWTTIACGVAAWVSIAASIALPADRSSIAERPGLAGVTGHPNQLGIILAIGTLLSLGLRATGPARFLLLVLQCGTFLGLLLTRSMTCLTFFIVAASAFFMLVSPPRQRVITFLLALPIAAAALSFGLTNLRDVALNAAGKDTTLSGRTGLWDIIIQQILSRPMLGAGFGAFWTEGKGRELVGTWNPRQSHQAYFDVLLDLGALGLIATVLCVVSAAFLPILRAAASRSPLPRESAALIALLPCLLVPYGLGESFLLKADKFPFFIMLWAIIVLTHHPKSLNSATLTA